jgi:hypothetical protein
VKIITHTRPVKRSKIAVVAPVHVGTGFEQGGDDVCVATNGREMERCVLVHVRRINIRSRFEEHM